MASHTDSFKHLCGESFPKLHLNRFSALYSKFAQLHHHVDVEARTAHPSFMNAFSLILPA